MYIGQKVRLREYRKEDIEKAQKYMNDPEMRRLLHPGIPYLYTFEDEEKWFNELSANKDVYNFAIETIKDKKYIGGCGLNKIDWKNSVAVVGIFIGDKEYWGKGYGTDAMKILIKFVFEQMNINKIKLNVFSFNQRAIKSYEKCGFRKEGILRQEIYRDGRYYDDIIMGILREEYNIN
ncbi:GNAT family N-acetyltransferase [Maledivibacter halophilus]|uniref:Protein N-acetyltransferase, RimJ/RimL family n=1 Tax=Maledivibacter halophilus TaxID=36842 RepID=A0A1T5M1P4_9FIRM|nr:GNAT family protein [Maledivibacter halophilus]SKC82182.1 Protein N-acetyltransferase, RimJ/RimL family [Maledivibacter halophilus]